MSGEKKVYFDNAATTTLRAEVKKAMIEALDTFGNPSSIHSFGRASKVLIEKARKNIAKELGVSASEIFFTSGGTEAINMVLKGAVRDLGITQIITSPTEHHAVLHTIQAIENEYGIQATMVKLEPNGTPDIEDLNKLLSQFLSDEKVLVSLMLVNNEIGNILPVAKVAEICKKYKAYLHCDTVQAVGHFPVDLSSLPIDFISASAHKFYGPKGVGFAFIRKGVNVNSLLFGGEQERGRRAGTESVHNIVGMEEAFLMAYQNMDKERAHIEGIKKYFIQKITQEIPQVHFNGLCANFQESSYTIVNISLPIELKKTEVLMLFLDMRGIACSQGSACQSGSAKGSHVLRAILPDAQWPEAHIRFSFSIYNTKKEVDYVIETLKEFLA